MPKYSFIVPVYNCGPYLLPCVESLLAQTFRDFEILLVDDGTPDNGGIICDELAAKYDCIRVFHKENGGAASARNYGIDQAQGVYLLFVDGDDTIEAHYLEYVDRVLSKSSVDLVISGMSFDYYEYDKLQHVELLGPSWACILNNEEWKAGFKNLFDRNCISSACSKVFSADLVRMYGIRFDENLILYEDFNFSVSYFQYVDHVALLPDGLYHYRIRLDANRYNSRISSIKCIEYMLAALNKSMQYVEPLYSRKIQSAILEQIAQESLNVLTGKPGKFLGKASEIADSLEFQRVFNWNHVSKDTNSRIFFLIYRKRYITLWGWIVYRKWRRSIIARIKRLVVR